MLPRLCAHLLLILLLFTAACARQSGSLETPPPSPFPEDPLWTPLPGGGGEEPAPPPYAPAKGDESMQRGEVTIAAQEIQKVEGPSPQYRLQVSGYLPTPCHELRAVVDEPDEQDQIHVQIYSLVDPGATCTQAPAPFEASISLGSYAGGSYTIFVNGEPAGEIPQ